MSGVQIAKLASSFSLLLLLAVAAWSSSFREFSRAIQAATTIEQAERICNTYADLVDTDSLLAEAVSDLGAGTTVVEVQRMVQIRAAGESVPEGNAVGQAKAIKSNPLYRDPGVQEESNWLDGALKRLGDLIPKQSASPDINLPNVPTVGMGWVVPLIWGLLGLAVLIFGYFAVRHFSWKRALKRKAKAVLEEDEPERTLDEWLALADEHLANARYREAVRAMYLSCLLKFDEAGVARFVRGETNWEHLNRISISPKKPAAIDFLPPTQAFDRIWYGFHVKGVEDVEQFRSWYQRITEALRQVGR